MYHTIKHLALSAQAITLRDQIVNLLSSLQYALNSLVQDNLGLVKLLLNLHDAVGLLRVLVFFEVVLQLGEGQDGLASGPRGARVLGEELVDDFAEELVGDQGGVLVVGDDDAADALGAAVGVESVVWLMMRVSGDGFFPPLGSLAREGWIPYLVLRRLVAGRVGCARQRSLRRGS